jgi:hypothetical protein
LPSFLEKAKQLQAGPDLALDLGLPANLPAGIYFLRFTSKKGTVFIRQVVVVRNPGY